MNIDNKQNTTSENPVNEQAKTEQPSSNLN